MMPEAAANRDTNNTSPHLQYLILWKVRAKAQQKSEHLPFYAIFTELPFRSISTRV